MEIVVVTNKDELKRAVASGADEIIVANDKLVKHLRAMKILRKAGPVALGCMLAAIPLIPATGGGSLFAVAAFSGGLATAGTASGVSGMAIAAMCVAIGGIVVIGIFTDFEEIELNGIFKLKRKAKASK